MFRGNGERWTFDQDRQLLELRKQGMSAAYIAKVLGRTIVAVSTRATTLKSGFGQFGVPQLRAPWTPEEDERLKSLKENGASWDEIVDEIGRRLGGIKHRWIGLQRKDE
jgi:hypothetical protein